MSSIRILCVGRVYVDLNFSGMPSLPELGQETFADALSLHAGGGAFITASYVSALGGFSELMANLPSDPFSQVVREEADVNGVGCSACAVESSGHPQLTVAMAHQEDRAFLTRRVGMALPADLLHRARQIVQSQRLTHLHVGELSTLFEHPDLLETARQLKLSVSLDCGWDESLFRQPGLDELLSQVDVFLPNIDEMTQLSRHGLDEYLAPLTVVKQGADGASAYWLEEHAQQARCRAEPQHVVDTIGAGDAFNAGFLCAWLRGASVEDAMQLGNACGAVAVSRRGGASGLGNLMPLLEQHPVQASR